MDTPGEMVIKDQWVPRAIWEHKVNKERKDHPEIREEMESPEKENRARKGNQEDQDRLADRDNVDKMDCRVKLAQLGIKDHREVTAFRACLDQKERFN